MKKTIRIIAVALVCVAGLSVKSYGEFSGACSASSFLGGGCSVKCETGYHPVCSGSFWSSSCSCDPDGGLIGPKLRTLPPIMPQQLALAQQFIVWAQSSPSPTLQQLGALAMNSTTALQQNNVQAFSDAEDQFAQAWLALPIPDRQTVSNWRVEHGLPN